MAEAGTCDACMLTPEIGFCDPGEVWLLSCKLLASIQGNYAAVLQRNGTHLLVKRLLSKQILLCTGVEGVSDMAWPSIKFAQKKY